MRKISYSKLLPKVCACVNSRRNFWTTNLKSSVQYTNALVRMVWVTTSVWLCMALVATGEVSHLLLLDSCQDRVTTSAIK